MAPKPDEGADGRTGGDDALCFTTGFSTAFFGAGALHAYLAADRKRPAVAAGISMGAISAAVTQRAYRDLERPRDEGVPLEARRWAFFRRYLSLLTDEPLRLFTRSLPTLSDFFSSSSEVLDRSTPEHLKEDELLVVAQRERLVRYGRWLAGLPLRIGDLARLARRYVECKERKGVKQLASGALLLLLLCRVATRLGTYIALHPVFGRPAKRAANEAAKQAKAKQAKATQAKATQAKTKSGEEPVRRKRVRPPAPARESGPLLGWRPWLAALALLVVSVALPSLLAASGTWAFHEGGRPFGLSPWLVGLLGAALCLVALLVYGGALGLLGLALKSADTRLGGGILRDFYLQRALDELFRESPETEPLLEHDDTSLLVVLTTLECLKVKGSGGTTHPTVDQFAVRPGVPLVEALRAAVVVPGLLPPLVVDKGSLNSWLPEGIERSDGSKEVFHLIDGGVIRTNPLPALFEYLAPRPGDADKDERAKVAQRLVERERVRGAPAMHVVFGMPTRPLPDDGRSATLARYEQAIEERGHLDVVDVGLMSSRLSQRVDLELEIEQARFTAKLEKIVEKHEGASPGRRTLPLTPHPVAPEDELIFQNPLAPTRTEILTTVAAGCRRTLEELYRRELIELSRSRDDELRAGGVACRDLLRRVGGRRLPLLDEAQPPGLSEVCQRCAKVLQVTVDHRASAATDASLSTLDAENAARKLSRRALASGLEGAPQRWRPRVVFVASGGVFRGSFHAGMIAALGLLRLRPDFVVGASVGSLMGAAYASMWRGSDPGATPRELLALDPQADKLVGNLTALLLRVDKNIAVTKSLLSAARELSTRAEAIRLSPRHLRAKIRQKSHDDPGFATIGAPADLVDAISLLLLLPHRKTARIAAELVAGHGSRAVAQLLQGLKAETLRRLDVEKALMGTSMLEPAARRLLESHSSRLSTRQPFAEDQVSFFATATNLRTQELALFGLDERYPGMPFDFVKGVLASAAFPAVFSPIPESDIFPGSGRRDVLYADGGLFDNLPFLPVMDVLGATQIAANRRDTLEFLEERHKAPDLLLVGALNVRPEASDFDSRLGGSFAKVHGRATSLSHNAKIRNVQRAMERADGQVERLLSQRHRLHSDLPLDDVERRFVDRIVSAVVHPVFPLDGEHLNGTFHFAPSVGLDERRLHRSIANGCFQTLRSFADDAGRSSGHERTLRVLQEEGRMVPVRVASERDAARGHCPYFVANPRAPIVCPFRRREDGQDHGEIHRACIKDRAHKAEHERSSSGKR